MPSDLASLLLYVGLLLPGFAFSVARSRHRPIEAKTGFGEAAAAAFVSVICDGALLVLLLVAVAWMPPAVGEVYRAVRDPVKELRANPYGVTLGVIAFLAVASALGYFLGTEWARERALKILRIEGPEQAGSSWHTAFTAVPRAEVLLQLDLVDGTHLQGTLYTYDRTATDTGDRGVTLSGQILRRRADSEELLPIDPEGGLLIVNDRNIRYMTVSYVAPTDSRAEDIGPNGKPSEPGP